MRQQGLRLIRVLSTVLSLLVVPAFYVVADRAKSRLARALRRGEPVPPPAEHQA